MFFLILWMGLMYVSILNTNLPLLQILINVSLTVILPLFFIKGKARYLRWSKNQVLSVERIFTLLVLLASIVLMTTAIKINTKNELLIGVFLFTKILIAIEFILMVFIKFLTPESR